MRFHSRRGPLAGQVETSYFGSFVIDPTAHFLKVLLLVAAGLTFLLSVDYVRRRGLDAGEYYATVLFATFGFMFMASARELIPPGRMSRCSRFTSPKLMRPAFWTLLAKA